MAEYEAIGEMDRARRRRRRRMIELEGGIPTRSSRNARLRAEQRLREAELAELSPEYRARRKALRRAKYERYKQKAGDFLRDGAEIVGNKILRLQSGCNSIVNNNLWKLVILAAITLGIQGFFLIHTINKWKSKYSKETKPDNTYTYILTALIIHALIVVFLCYRGQDHEKFVHGNQGTVLLMIDIIGIAFIAYVGLHWTDDFNKHDKPPWYYIVYGITVGVFAIWLILDIIYCSVYGRQRKARTAGMARPDLITEEYLDAARPAGQDIDVFGDPFVNAAAEEQMIEEDFFDRDLEDEYALGGNELDQLGAIDTGGGGGVLPADALGYNPHRRRRERYYDQEYYDDEFSPGQQQQTPQQQQHVKSNEYQESDYNLLAKYGLK